MQAATIASQIPSDNLKLKSAAAALRVYAQASEPVLESLVLSEGGLAHQMAGIPSPAKLDKRTVLDGFNSAVSKAKIAVKSVATGVQRTLRLRAIRKRGKKKRYLLGGWIQVLVELANSKWNWLSALKGTRPDI